MFGLDKALKAPGLGPVCPSCGCQHPMLAACPGRPAFLSPFIATFPLSGDTKKRDD